MSETRKINISVSRLLSSPWAIKRSMADAILTNIVNKQKSERGGEFVIDYKEYIRYEVVNNKAIIDVSGIFYNKCMIDDYWGYVICDLEKTLIAAVDDMSVDEIILKIESPGGYVYGVSEVHDLILKLKIIKPINAYVNGLACSALYWIPSACTNIYAYKQSDIGSIGVYSMHIDYSKFYESLGIKIEYIHAGSKKTVGNPYEPLSLEDKGYLQESINQTYVDFTSAVAKARNLDLEQIEVWADGKDFEAKQALELGLIDEIKSWQEVLGNNISNDNFVTSLLKRGSRIMAIGEKKISELNAEDLQAKNPELYESIYNTGFAAGKSVTKSENEKEITDLKAVNSNLKSKVETYEKAETLAKEQQQIRDFAKSLNLEEEGEALIKDNKSIVEAFSALVEKSKETKAEQQANFKKGAPKSAGNASDGMADDVPKNEAEAIKFCQERDKSSRKAAWKQAHLEFPKLFGTKTTNEEESE